jgi:hypothetical protein
MCVIDNEIPYNLLDLDVQSFTHNFDFSAYNY